VDRLGPRRLVLMGGAILAAGLVASSYATELWHMIIIYGLVMNFGANCLGLVAFVPLLSKYFVRNRGMAVSVVQSANGFARAYSAPAATLMISGLGWRGAYLWQGIAMAAAILPLAALFRGTDTKRATRAERREKAATEGGWTVRQAMRTPHFWLLTLVYVFTGLGSFLVALHQLAFAGTLGAPGLNQSLTLTASSAAPNSLLVLAVGGQQIQVPLPAPWSSCNALATLDSNFVFFANAAGVGTLPLTLPPLPGLAGYLQAGALDAAGGLDASNGLFLRNNY